LWNWFDFVVLWVTIALAIIEVSSQHQITILRIIRTLRIVCVFRILNHVRGLQILMLAFFKTMTEWVAPAILLLLITMYIFAIISDHYFNSEDVWWGNIGRCLLSLMSYFSVRIRILHGPIFCRTAELLPIEVLHCGNVNFPGFFCCSDR